jgi:pyridinium-3,5-bisthiocarboxylic acid mononucleotide nickel chelatase
MAMGALVDAGADLDQVRELCGRLPVSGWKLEAESVLRSGIGATKINVLCEPTTVVRTSAHIAGLVDEARLPDRVSRRALAVFDALAVAEGRLHRRPPEQVHFHEVGGIDAILDVVGTCAALEILGVDQVWCSPVANGIGMIRAAHGMLPNPAPAVVELLTGAPTYQLDIAVELTTPTGAALMAALAVGWGTMPAMTVRGAGFGAGTVELEHRPNLTQVVLGERAPELERGQPITHLEVNVDDITGEHLADAVTQLLDAGAVDAWITPIVMKKGRPAYTVSALCDPVLAAQVRDALVRSTGSFGVRGQTLERWPEGREIDEVDVSGYPIRIKVGAGRAKVEHDDAARVARRIGLPLHEVVSQAEAAWRRRSTVTRLASAPDGGDARTGADDTSSTDPSGSTGSPVGRLPSVGTEPPDPPDDAG